MTEQKSKYETVWSCPHCKRATAYFYNRSGNFTKDILQIRSFKCARCNYAINFDSPMLKLKETE